MKQGSSAKLCTLQVILFAVFLFYCLIEMANLLNIGGLRRAMMQVTEIDARHYILEEVPKNLTDIRYVSEIDNLHSELPFIVDDLSLQAWLDFLFDKFWSDEQYEGQKY
jgi:hypothetical protein